MEPEVRLTLHRRRWPVDLADPPLLGVLLEQRAAAGGIDVQPAGDVAPDGVEETIGVALAVEVAGLLRPPGYSRQRARYRPPGRLSMLAMSPPESLVRSSKSPQVLRKSSGSEDYNGVVRAPTVTIGENKTAGQRPF